MRLPTLDALRASPIYKSLASLAKMPVFRQKRFLEVFNRIFDLATRRGASEDVAEANATAIAVLAAERYTPTPSTASLETEEHYFATMAEFQYSNGGLVEVNDFSFMLANLDTVNAAIEGNAFNLRHEHTEPTGVIRRIVKPDDAPAEIRAKHPDAPFFTVGSYYEGTSEELRAIETVSAEWLQMKAAADGSRGVFLPDSFALTTNPATPKVLGVGKVAGLTPSGNGYEGHDAVEGARDTMPTTVEELQATVASLQKEAVASKEAATKAKDIQEKFANLEKEHKALSKSHEEFVAKVASLTGKAPEKGAKPDESEALTGLTSRLASLQSDVEKMKTEAKQAEADAWADKVVKTKEIAMDAKPKLASLFLSAKQSALDLEASLPGRIAKPGDAKGTTNVTKLEGKAAEEHLAFIGEAFR
jgi:outer membrane murein-binding lipoprotein Lpp